MPPTTIQRLKLEYAAPVQATLAGNFRVNLNYYRATIVWDATLRDVAVLEMDGAPLVGMALLIGQRLTVDVMPDGPVRIESIQA